ncbi:MAG: hypothetical protein JO287_18950 [Pseudonocardiales bacterium]|nr:hypothetical protein [Pseudonocardiales bacterium]
MASGATVLVLTGIVAGVFSTPPADPLVPQANPVDQHAANLVPQPVPAPQPSPAPQPDPAPQAVAIQQPEAVKQPITFAAAPVRRQPVTQPAVVRAPVPPQPLPAHDPAPIAEAAPDPEQHSSPPAPPPSAPHQKSRTVNTAPCACDGTMRRVPNHWEPPQN